MSNPSDRVLGTPPTNTSALSENLPFASLAAAVAPHWGVTILRLAQATDRLSSQFDQFVGVKTKADTVKACRELTQELINFLDEIGGDTDQDSAVDDDACCDNELEISEGDDEPSLGSIGHGDPGPIRYFNRLVDAAGEMVDDCEGDEHDGREPQEDDEHGGDNEPGFGWSNEEAAKGRYPSQMGHCADCEGESA